MLVNIGRQVRLSQLSRNWVNIELTLLADIEKGTLRPEEVSREICCMLCKAMGEDCKIHFLNSQRSWVPCHVKFDTESMLQMFTPYRRQMEWRRSFGEEFNNSVCGTLLKCKKVDSKSKKFSFHHELLTDGVSVSLLYSRVSARGERNIHTTW